MESAGFVESSIRFCELTIPTGSLNVDAVSVGLKVSLNGPIPLAWLLFDKYPVITEAFS